MFARTIHLSVNGLALAAVAAITLVVGSACAEGPDCVLSSGCGRYITDAYSAVARGANVVPAAVDTSPRASLVLNGATLAYEYNIVVVPAGIIDSIALYQVDAGQALPPSATLILCAGAAKCAATSGTGTLVPPATMTTIRNSIRGFSTQLVFFTTTAQKDAGGAMRGTMYLTLQ